MPSLTRTPTADGGSTGGVGARHVDCAPGGMRVVGRVPVAQRQRLDCDQPLRAVCRECDYVAEWRCDSYGCGPCGETKRRRLQRVIEDGAAVQIAAGLYGYFITLTAPGHRDHLRWYQGKRPARRRECECHRHGLSDGQWNAQESKCWNRLRTAMTRDRRVVFAGSIETQKRGLLHRHVVVFTDKLLGYEDVQELALRAGYGCVLDIEPLESPQKAARYISKYASKGSAERPDVPWSRVVVNQHTGEIVDVSTRATYRLWSSSQRWGVTMRQLRATASAQARARARYLAELGDLLASEETPAAAAGLAPAASGSPPPT